MSDNTNTAESGAGAPAPAVTQDPSADALAVAQAATPSEPAKASEPSAEDKAKAEADKAAEEKKRNRTRDYINRINRENAELRAQLQRGQQPAAQPQQPQPQQRADTGPTLEEHNFDLASWQRARDAWVLQQAKQTFQQETQQQAQAAREQETWASYESRAAEFADSHPDYLEVVGSIAYPLTEQVQAAIAAHPNGPEIAYHLGNNDDDTFALASIQPHLAAAAVQRIASRLGAAPQQPAAPAAPAAPAPKPITQAPPPAPTVSGRAPTETPAEKLTDEEWFKREQAKGRRR